MEHALPIGPAFVVLTGGVAIKQGPMRRGRGAV